MKPGDREFCPHFQRAIELVGKLTAKGRALEAVMAAVEAWVQDWVSPGREPRSRTA